MILTKEYLGGPWDWGLVQDICVDILGPAGDPQQWVLGGNSNQIEITGPAVEGNEVSLEEGIQVHVSAGEASWTESQKDQVATSLNDGQPLRVAIVKAIVGEINLLRAQHGLAPRTLAQVKTAIRNHL